MTKPAASRAKSAKEVSLGDVAPYRLESVVRGGAAFTTFKAVHREVGHAVWITMTPPSAQVSETANARLLQASTVLARLGFEAALGLLDVLSHEGRTAVVTRAPSGPSLRDVMDALSAQKSASLELRGAAAWMLGKAVAKIHEAGVAHGALCPESAFVTDRGEVVVGGLWDARVLGQDQARNERDVPGAGPEEGYKSPERVSGAPADRAGDVFSLGVILYELLSERHPFEDVRGVESTARRIRTLEPDPIEAPTAIERVVGKSLQKVPTLRYENAGRFADDLASALGGAERAGALARGLVARMRGRPEIAVSAADPPGAAALARRLAIVLAAMVAVGLWVVLYDPGSATKAGVPKGAASASVRLLARPWADVYVDGNLFDTTPIGRPLLLSPGRHELVFRHPRAPEAKRTLDLTPGQVLTVEVEMDVKRPVVDAGVEESP